MTAERTSLSLEKSKDLLKGIPNWTLKGKSIEREFKFVNFGEAINFVNKVASTAEAENHHPDIHIFYNKVKLELSTHDVGGLSGKDFILAAQIDQLSYSG
jgi:4a-hydroxytetrahydrobiopterin dehydratase